MTAQTAASADRNEVLLQGRLAALADERTTPGGQVRASFRVVVRRPDGDQPTVDTIDCVATGGRARRSVLGWLPGDEVEVAGSLRRNFDSGSLHRVEVLVGLARLVRRARRARS